MTAILNSERTEMKKVLILDFGGQYNLLIARRVRQSGVYCEIKSYRMKMDEIKAFNPDAVILTGGPATVFEDNAPRIDKEVFEMGIPVLGICYGMQLMVYENDGKCRKAEKREYGKVLLNHGQSLLFKDVPDSFVCWMSHGIECDVLPEGFKKIASSSSCSIAAIENSEKKLYGVQFHPEVLHTEYGTKILENFLYEICGFTREWNMKDYVSSAIESIKEKVGSKKVLLALSGGVDSSVCAALLYRAVGKNLICVFVDHGLLRKNEGVEVEKALKASLPDADIRRIDREELFLDKLEGVTEPERKRKIIGETFIRVFEEESRKIGKVEFLAQGTIYPDVVESGLGGESAVIKSHHNVGGLPSVIAFDEIIEPLRMLFKDEVRELGLELGLPESLVMRQPFPGPGLAIRVIGDITKEKLDILRDADAILREEVIKLGYKNAPSQYFVALTNMRSVGVMGDERSYDWAVVIRAVNTTDFMTATFSRLDWELLDKVSSRIVGEVKHINRVLYDITSKPPATIELE